MSVRRYEMGKLVSKNQAALTLETTADLRSLLLEQIKGVVTGNVTADQAKAICGLSEQVYKTAKLELEFAEAKKQAAPLRLVSDDD